MDAHRLVNYNHIDVVPITCPFSCFDYVEKHYPPGSLAIRRLFSLARSDEARTLITEKIEPVGIILDENDEIGYHFPDHRMAGLDRISFWKSPFTADDIRQGKLRNQDCVGYAILKRDIVPSNRSDQWTVFEAVFKKYDHPHNCVPAPMEYTVSLAGEQFQIPGVLYAQQNGMNRRCAQVALRSLISRALGHDVSYREINKLASWSPTQEGLEVSQIRNVLNSLGIKFVDYDYDINPDLRHNPGHYQKCVYAGIESGMGALVGFKLAGPSIQQNEAGHIIPFYGHTFNKDTWTPEAEIAYFRVGDHVAYIPSDHWTSSFLGHDDNFGPNFCVPRLYLFAQNVNYVVELLRPGFAYSGVDAEAQSLRFLYSVLDYLDQVNDNSGNVWLSRLVFSARSATIQRIVLRAIAVDRDTYVDHVSTERDWSGNSEFVQVISILRTSLPEHLWVVEISVPQLFPANQRKEVLLK